MPPLLSPRKPSISVIPSLPCHSLLVKMPQDDHPGMSVAHRNVLIQQSLQVTRVVQSSKKAEQCLEQEHVGGPPRGATCQRRASIACNGRAA